MLNFNLSTIIFQNFILKNKKILHLLLRIVLSITNQNLINTFFPYVAKNNHELPLYGSTCVLSGVNGREDKQLRKFHNLKIKYHTFHIVLCVIQILLFDSSAQNTYDIFMKTYL